MIMISSNSAQKVGKPPPPVPPRPSKSVVAEALAKSRQHNRAVALQEAAKTKAPSRQAPPPPLPLPRTEISKSKSSYSVNVSLKKPVVYERSISEEVRNTSRPVIYQSANVKCVNNNNSVQITSKDSDVKIVNNSAGGLRCQQERIVQEEGRNRVQVTGKESVKRDKSCGEESAGKHVGTEGNDAGNDATTTTTKSSSSTMEKPSSPSSSSSEKNGSTGSLEKNWDQMLNDRNHVNTLIDEMFASVLEVHFNDDDNGQSNDKMKIIINNTGDYENVRFDNGVVVGGGGTANNRADEGEVPKTVIVIKDSSDVSGRKEKETKKKQDEVSDSSNTSSAERQKQVKFKDQFNHELLIDELQCMKQDQQKILKRQRKPSMNIYDDDNGAVTSDDGNVEYPRPDWSDVDDVSGETKFNTCHIEIGDGSADGNAKQTFTLDYERITKMSSLHGLPPLPKSLSGFNLLDGHHNVNPPTPMRSSSIRAQVPPGHLVYPPHPKMNGDANPATTPGRKFTNLDTQLAILRREMVSRF
ncbi:hypothetical protein NQ315_007690, partial [Exocentrus adspersus]